MPELSSPPLANDPSSRSPEGTILDQSQLQPTSTSTPSQTQNEPVGSTQSTPGNPAQPAAAPAGAPESYDFKAPEGQELDKTVLESATPIFRELGLDNAQAQKLVDFYAAQMKGHADTAREAIVKMGNDWSAETMNNPRLGPHIDTIKEDVGRGLDVLDQRSPGLKAKFQSAMDQTMVGNHPAFVEAFWELCKIAAPGRHVAGGNPSPLGQSPTGTIAPKSAASAMYPHLVSRAG